jgi:superfamily II DNA or RNA helicase
LLDLILCLECEIKVVATRPGLTLFGLKKNNQTPAPIKAFDSDAENSALANLQFRFPLRRYQKEILDLVNEKLGRGERELHIVAPPGAGKTIIGLQIISQFKVPSLILCPNTTIQSQWGQKAELFLPPDAIEYGTSDLIGTHEDKPLKPITLLTYQVLSTPGKEQEYIETLAHKSWVDELTAGRAMTAGDAELRIIDLLQNNPKAHQKEISRHASRLRKRLSEVLDLNDVLHENAIELLQALRRQNFQLVIFDECHHLTDYWAAIMTHLIKYLKNPVIIGLTGTPPEGKTATQETRYLSLVGNIDYQVPTPALVKEGGLAPFQDLVYFSEPTPKELLFLQEQHQEFHQLICDLTGLPSSEASKLVQPNKLDVDTYLPGADTNAVAVSQQEVTAAMEVPTKQQEVVDEQLAPTAEDTDLTAWIKQRVIKESAVKTERVKEEVKKEKPVKQSKVSKKEAAGKPYIYRGIESLLTRLGKASKTTDSADDPYTPPAVALPVITKFTSHNGWKDFVARNSALADAYCRYLWKLNLPLPRGTAQVDSLRQSPFLDDWMLILEDFASHKLRTSPMRKDHLLYERIKASVRKLGYGITEQGLRRQASPVDRVLAFSNSKPLAVAKVLDIEYRHLQDRLRAVVVTDFERMSATAVQNLDGVLDEESGGAIATLRILLNSTVSEYLNPCLVTGSLVLVDKRITQQFLEAARAYISDQGYKFELVVKQHPDLPFDELTASSSNWESRLYVGMATSIFERGITKCLIGTRGLFGEGWDSQSLNTLIDLTTTTSPVSVKQLRGRSIRLQTNDPLGARKVANNWDVVCIAPQLEKGLNDYYRFVKKHDGYFGICDDGQIECGVGHVHAAFSELTPAEVFCSADEFNHEMMDRALVRDSIWNLWKVGEPYKNRSLGCIEVTGMRKLALTPPNIRKDLRYTDHAKHLRSALAGVWFDYLGVGLAGSLFFSTFISSMLAPASMSYITTMLPFVSAAFLGYKKHKSLFNRMKAEVCQPNTQESSLTDIANAVLSALQRINLVPSYIERKSIKVSIRSDGSYRIFLDDVEPEPSKNFTISMREVLSPVTTQPFLIPKYEYPIPQSMEGTMTELDFFKAYLAGEAQPRVAAYHPVPSLLARSSRGRNAFQSAWNKYVSPGFIVAAETRPELISRYFGIGPSLAQRLLWE